MSSISSNDYNNITSLIAGYLQQDTTSSGDNAQKTGDKTQDKDFSALLRNVSFGDVGQQNTLFSNFNKSLQRSPVEFKEKPNTEHEISAPKNEQSQVDGQTKTDKPSQENVDNAENQQTDKQEQNPNQGEQKTQNPNQGEQNGESLENAVKDFENILGQLGIQLSAQDLSAIKAALNQLRVGGSGEKLGQLLNFLRHQLTQGVSEGDANLLQIANTVKEALVDFGKQVTASQTGAQQQTVDVSANTQQNFNGEKQQNVQQVVVQKDTGPITTQTQQSDNNKGQVQQTAKIDTTQASEQVKDTGPVVQKNDQQNIQVEGPKKVEAVQASGQQVAQKEVVEKVDNTQEQNLQNTNNNNRAAQQKTGQEQAQQTTNQQQTQDTINNDGQIQFNDEEIVIKVEKNTQNSAILWRANQGLLNGGEQQDGAVFSGSLLVQQLAAGKEQGQAGSQQQATDTNVNAEHQQIEQYIHEQYAEAQKNNQQKTDLFRPILEKQVPPPVLQDNFSLKVADSVLDGKAANSILNARAIIGGAEHGAGDKGFAQNQEQQHTPADGKNTKAEQTSRNQEQAELLKAQREKYQKALQQITQSIQRAISNGDETISIQLKPRELGQVQTAITFTAERAVNVQFTADKLETIEALKEDKKTLATMLQDLGYDCDEDCFNFSHNNASSSGQSKEDEEFDAFLRAEQESSFSLDAGVDAAQKDEKNENIYVDGWVLAQTLLNDILPDENGHIDIRI